MRLVYKFIYRLRARRLAARDAALDAEWRRWRPADSTHGDRAEWQRLMVGRR